MTSPSTHFVASSRLGAYESFHLIGMWDDVKVNGLQNTKLENQSEDSSRETLGLPDKFDQDAVKSVDKVHRRLAQNREAARKCRLRKKAYVQELENSKLRLIQLEQTLERAGQQGICMGGGLRASHLGNSRAVNSGIAAFEIQYAKWVEDQNKQISELKTALHSHVVTDMELYPLVQGSMAHYFILFRMKATAAKADVFYLMSGMWRTSAERFFLWIGGFRPSELIQFLLPQLQTLTDPQVLDVYSLRQSCQQEEEALSQGMDKLRQNLSDCLAACQVCERSYIQGTAPVMEKLEGLISFANQADHIRQETLNQMSRILTTRQTAQGLVALGEYFQRLRTLSSLWTTHPGEPI